MKKNNNVYGLMGVGVYNANYNAGEDKYPKNDGEGNLFATPYVPQFMIRELQYRQGKKILLRKSFKTDGSAMVGKERYESLFNIKDKKPSKAEPNNYIITKKNLLSCDDVKQFGVCYTGDNSMGITGAIQIGVGYNKYEGTTIQNEIILSPFASASDNKTSTMGERIFTDEAHYVHSFSVNPKQYDEYMEEIEDYEGFQEEDYTMFKNASLMAVSCFNSKAKAGCYNEFGLFVETKDDVKNMFDLNGLDRYVKVTKNDEDKVVYDLTEIAELLNTDVVKENLKSIEIYYNKRTVAIEGDIDNVKKFDIITKKEIK